MSCSNLGLFSLVILWTNKANNDRTGANTATGERRKVTFFLLEQPVELIKHVGFIGKKCGLW